MKETFINWKPHGKSFVILKNILEILDNYAKQGYRLTLRQLYYQLVARDLIPNNIKSYNMIGNLVSNARLAGIIDWTMIEDRVRIPSQNAHWGRPSDIVNAAADQFYLDHWKGQKNYVEVWCEKDAVSNILSPVCHKWDVLFMANRGYSSQTAMYDAYKRLRNAYSQGKKIYIVYFGDHDPSGMDMTRDIEDRIGLFLYKEETSFENVNRIALNIDQVKLYNPPENPAKMSDSRYKKYSDEFGGISWELDALEPSVLSKLVESAIKKYVNVSLFKKVIEEQESKKEKIKEKAEELEIEEEEKENESDA